MIRRYIIEINENVKSNNSANQKHVEKGLRIEKKAQELIHVQSLSSEVL